MKIFFTHELEQNVSDEIYEIVKDYVGEYFTPNFPEEIIIDAKFQRIGYLSIENQVVCAVVFTAMDGVPLINLMVTKRSFKGQGYGKILMNSLVNYLSQKGLSKIELYTHIPEKKPVNANTVAFYESVGFMKDGVYHDMWENGALKMTRYW